jgi:hypothetical protein
VSLVHQAKLLQGRRFDDPEVQARLPELPYTLAECDEVIESFPNNCRSPVLMPTK